MIWEGELLVNDSTLDLLLIAGVEGRETGHQLVEEGSQSVEVHPVGVTRLLYHFRGHVLGGPAETVGDFSTVEARLAQPEVSYLDVAVVIDQQVFRFEVPVNDILLVEVHESVQDLNEIKTGVLLAHPLDRLEVVEQLAAGAI